MYRTSFSELPYIPISFLRLLLMGCRLCMRFEMAFSKFRLALGLGRARYE